MWSSEQTETLVSMAPLGASAAEIANTIGKTRNAVIGRAHRIGVQLLGNLTPAREKTGRRKRRLTPRVKVEKKIAPPPEPAEFKHLGLVELSESMCRWPHGDGPFTFCGQSAWGSPYCPYHHNRALACSEVA